jgi:hypothetical protein
MDEPSVTFGVLMGMEVENEHYTSAGGSVKEAVLIFCPTGELEEGQIDVTLRMTDLALMGFAPVAITRWDPQDTDSYMIFAKEGLSESLTNAVSNEAGNVVREALEGSELLKYSTTDNNNN